MTAMLEMRGVSKSFAGVRALRDVNFTVNSGEIQALVGENCLVVLSIHKAFQRRKGADGNELYVRELAAVELHSWEPRREFAALLAGPALKDPINELATVSGIDLHRISR